jgi:hypothetical protein
MSQTDRYAGLKAHHERLQRETVERENTADRRREHRTVNDAREDRERGLIQAFRDEDTAAIDRYADELRSRGFRPNEITSELQKADGRAARDVQQDRPKDTRSDAERWTQGTKPEHRGAAAMEIPEHNRDRDRDR